MSNPSPSDSYARVRGEQFEVVLLKKGVHPLEAKVEDFKRLGVVAGSPTEAMADPTVEAEKDFVPVQAVNPSAPQEYEQMARDRERRKEWGGSVDLTKY